MYDRTGSGTPQLLSLVLELLLLLYLHCKDYCRNMFFMYHHDSKAQTIRRLLNVQICLYFYGNGALMLSYY